MQYTARRLHAASLAILLALASGVSVRCESAPEPPPVGKLVPRSFPAGDVESYSYRSRIMDRIYDINIGFPPRYKQNPQRRYPTLIVTDGKGLFPLANSMARRLGDERIAGEGRIRQLLIIGIGAPFEEGQLAETRRRVYEFSPTDWHSKADFSQYMQDFCRKDMGVEPAQCVGGAARFLQFITTELLPELAKRYRIDLEDLGLSGHSAGGFFTTWVMFQESSPFKRYIASSPVMNYGNGEIFRQETRYASAHRDLPIGVYMSSGVLEIDEAGIEDLGRIVSGQAQLASLLRRRNYPTLALYSEFQQGLGHEDVPPASFARGLRLLYAPADAGD